MKGRQEILELYLQDKPVAEDVDMKALARGTPGFNGAGNYTLALRIKEVGLYKLYGVIFFPLALCRSGELGEHSSH